MECDALISTKVAAFENQSTPSCFMTQRRKMRDYHAVTSEESCALSSRVSQESRIIPEVVFLNLHPTWKQSSVCVMEFRLNKTASGFNWTYTVLFEVPGDGDGSYDR